MTKLLLTLAVATFSCSLARAEVVYELAHNWLTPPTGSETIGNGHGEIAVDSSGNIYVSVEGKVEGGLQVFGPDGKFLRN